MSNFNKVFNPKIISLIVICAILLTNTAYGIDLSRKSHLRKPLDFNNANGDGRFHGVLSKIAGSMDNGAVSQAIDNPKDVVNSIVSKEYGRGITIEDIKNDYRQLLSAARHFGGNPFHIMTDKINSLFNKGILKEPLLLSHFFPAPDITGTEKSQARDHIWVPQYKPSLSNDFVLLKELRVPSRKHDPPPHKFDEGINVSPIQLFYGWLELEMPEIANIIIQIYQKKVAISPKIKKLIGISGLVAGGKTDISKSMRNQFESIIDRQSVIVETDDYKYSREERKDKGLKGEEALDKSFMLSQILDLLKGRVVRLRKIDKESQKISYDKPVILKEDDLVILEGAYAWFWPEIEKPMGFKIMVFDLAFARLFKKGERDAVLRGYGPRENLEVFALAELEEGPLVVEKQIPGADVILDYSGYVFNGKVKLYVNKKTIAGSTDTATSEIKGSLRQKDTLSSSI